MSHSLVTTIAQLNVTVGDIEGNCNKITTSYAKACADNADLCVFSEMCITGYPPEDLILRKHFQQQAMDAVQQLANATKNHNTAMLVGGIWCENEHLYNSAFLLKDGTILQRFDKVMLPNYGVFDEKRHFTPGESPKTFILNDVPLGVLICEDMWDINQADALKQQGVSLIVVINASPFESHKQTSRQDMAVSCCRATQLPLCYVNQIGGQDELVFEGHSFVMDRDGKMTHQAQPWEEDTLTIHWEYANGVLNCLTRPSLLPAKDYETSVYQALKLGLHDYVLKNGFYGVIIGMSGGIDSALTAAIAVDTLGKEKVMLVMMPYTYTSEDSLRDAQECADNLSVILHQMPIVAMVDAAQKSIAPLLEGTTPHPTTDENLQSRSRGALLMALSNATGYMVLTTGNKSEMAVGYATLYGDMCGGYNALKDIYKTDVFTLAKWRNNVDGIVIPENIINKPPSAELKPDQTDQDSLPPYDELDAILYRLIEQRLATDEIIAQGYDADTVRHISRLVMLSEYKRRQAPPGVKVTQIAFGRDRRYPITNKAKI